MIASIRRIGLALLVCGVLACSIGTFGAGITFCEHRQDCSAALVGIESIADIPMLEGSDTALITQSERGTSLLSLADFYLVAQLAGVYMLIAALVSLIILEAFELYYLRALLEKLRVRA